MTNNQFFCLHSQVVDYAIARRIVDLHARLSESVERFYSVEDIQRYLTFARQFQPQVSYYDYKTRVLNMNLIVSFLSILWTDFSSNCLSKGIFWNSTKK